MVRCKTARQLSVNNTVGAVQPDCLDNAFHLLFIRNQFRDELTLRAADRDPQRCKEIPEATTRQRDAPPGAFVLWPIIRLSGGWGLPKASGLTIFQGRGRERKGLMDV